MWMYIQVMQAISKPMTAEKLLDLSDKGIYNIYVSKDGKYPAIVRKHILLTRDIDDDTVNELVYAVNDLVDYYKTKS